MALDPINVKYFKLALGSDIGKETTVDINAKCCICGDSTKNKNKKRLHLYTKKSMDYDVINCFNCNWTGNMYSFLKENFPSLYNSYKKEIQESTLNSIASLKDVSLSLRSNTEPIKQDVKLFDIPSNFIDIKTNIQMLRYIISRKIKPTGIWYFSNELFHTKINLRDFLIIPLTKNDKMYGFYSRKITSKFFFTWIPDENMGYKIWNWFNINKSKPVYVFEGIFDALSSGLENIISILGADLNEERVKELKDPIFCFDNDSTGKMKAKKYSKLGFKVLIWPLNYKGIDLENIKDMNDLMRITSKEFCSDLILNNTFSGLVATIKLKL
jgi:hypothetical protein